MTIEPQTELTIDLRKALADLSASADFSDGSLAIQFTAAGMTPLVGQITIADTHRSLSFESVMFNHMAPMGPPKQLNSIWWGLGGGREARVVVSNASDQPALADVVLDFDGKRHPAGLLRFSAHETKSLSIVRLLDRLGVDPAQAPAGGISITQRGSQLTLIAAGSIVDPSAGFSTTMHFLLPEVQSRNILYASGVPIGTPGQDSPFAGSSTFNPHVVVRNLLSTPQNASITIEYPTKDGTGQAAIGPFSLDAYSTSDLSLDTWMDQVPRSLPFCSVRIQYSGPPGSATAEVASVEADENLVVDSKLANEGDMSADSGFNPWRVDNQTESILFISNMGDKETAAGLQIQADGVHYYVTDLILKPHETRAINLRRLRDSQKPDFWGKKIPAHATNGSVYWIAVGKTAALAGRMLVLRKGEGLASNFDCGDSCLASLIGLMICPVQNGNMPSGECQWQAMAEYQDANGSDTWSDKTSSTAWSTDNTAVATFSSTTPGLMYVSEPGTANASGSLTGFVHIWNGIRCVASQSTVSAERFIAIHYFGYELSGVKSEGGVLVGTYVRCAGPGTLCYTIELPETFFTPPQIPNYLYVHWLTVTIDGDSVCFALNYVPATKCIPDQ